MPQACQRLSEAIFFGKQMFIFFDFGLVFSVWSHCAVGRISQVCGLKIVLLRACRTNIRHLYACRLSTFVRVPKGRCHLPPTVPPSIIPQVVCLKALKLARVLFGVVISDDKIHVCSHKTRTLCRRSAMMDYAKSPSLSVLSDACFMRKLIKFSFVTRQKD